MLSLFVRSFLIGVLGVTLILAKETSRESLIPDYTEEQKNILHVNRWVYWQFYDGRSAIRPDGNAGGLYNSIAHIYTDGVLFGYYDGNEIYLIGNRYRNTWNPLQNRIYRIRRDWRTVSDTWVRNELALLGYSSITDRDIQALRERLMTDWENWPWQQGAPWLDVNGNGIYEPDIDEAGYPFADDVIFYRVNDQDTQKLYEEFGSKPLGIQLTVVLWGVDVPVGPLGKTLFKSIRIQNISGVRRDSLHFSVWVDPDLGYFFDDVVGCDSLLGLAYAYNGTDDDAEFAQYGLNPGAVGYDVVIGPAVPFASDTAWVGGNHVPGFKNLSMTSFNVVWSGLYMGEDVGDVNKNFIFNLIRGYRGDSDPFNPEPMRHFNNGTPTLFPLNGDPITGQGDIDNQPRDKTFFLNIGTFPLETNQLQEVHIAIMAGKPGESRVDAVADLKRTDKIIQKVADSYFAYIPRPPLSPAVTVTTMADTIILDWGEDALRVKEIEETLIYDSDSTAYRFEGYIVYQLPTEDAVDRAMPIAVFDRKNGVKKIYGWRFVPELGEELWVPIIEGKDTGVQHTLVITRDYLNNSPLLVGNTYYFGVRAYSYNANPQVVADEGLISTMSIVAVVPQSPQPGLRYPETVGNLLPVTHVSGSSNGQVTVQVINPAEIQGQQYEVFFTADADTSSPTSGQVKVNIRRLDDDVVLVQNRRILQDDDGVVPIVADGLAFYIQEPAVFKDFRVIANANGLLAQPVGAAATWYGFPGNKPESGQQANGSIWLIQQSQPDQSAYAFFEQVTTAFLEDQTASNYEIRFTAQVEAYFPWSVQDFAPIPFEVWNIGDEATPDDDYRVFVFVRDIENTVNQGEFNITYIDHTVSPGDNDPMTDSFYLVEPWDTTPGEGGYQAFRSYLAGLSNSEILNGAFWRQEHPGISRPGLVDLVLVNWNGGSVPAQERSWQQYNYNAYLPETGTIFQILANQNFTVEDVYRVSARPVVESVKQEYQDVQRVTVYPNPYLAGHELEKGGDEFIYFYHLPRQATIRIFSLDGQLVRTLAKSDDSQFLRWDLRNTAGRRVASGIYIAHLEMTLRDGTKVQKVLKIAIVQRLEPY